MARNPYINKYKKYLQKEEKQRQSYLNKDRRNTLLKGVAVGVGIATAGHIVHPKGIVGALEDVSKHTRAFSEATSDAYKKIGGFSALTDPLSYRGLNITKYITDIENYKYRSLPKMGDKFKEFATTYNKSYSNYLEKNNELYTDQLRKQTEKLVSSAEYEYKRSLIYNKVDETLIEAAKKRPDQVETVRKKLSHRIADLAFETTPKAKSEFMRIGMNEEGANFMVGLLDTAKKDVDEFVQKIDMDSFRNNIKDQVMKDIIKERQDELTRGIGSRVTRTARGLTESAFGYKKATIADVEKLADSASGIDISKKTLDFLETLKKQGADAEKFIVDDDLLVHGNKLVSAIETHKQMQSMRSVFAEGVLGHLLYQRDSQLTREFSRKAGVVMRSGYHNFGLSDTSVVGKDFRLKETLYGIGDSAYKVIHKKENKLELEKIKSGLEFTSGRFASTQRLMTQMSGINSPDYDKWWESKVLDIADQGSGSWGKIKSIFTKHSDKDWMPNKIKSFINHIRSTGSVPDNTLARQVQRYIDENAAPLPQKVMERITKELDDLNIKFDTEDNLVEAYTQLAKKSNDNNYSEEILRGKANNILSQKRVLQRKGILADNKLQDGEEILKKHISNMLIKEHGVLSTLELSSEMFKAGDLITKQHKETGQAITAHIIDRAYSNFSGTYEDPVTDVFKGSTEIGLKIDEVLKDMLSKSHPATGFGPISDYENAFHGDVLALNKFTLNDFFKTFTAGRNNMGDVHKGTLLMYGTLSRVNDLVKEFNFLPIGLSDKSMGSSGDILKNAFLKRILPAYIGLEAFRYINDHSKDWTGYTLSQREERAKAHTRLTLSGIKDKLGITNFFKQIDLATPGSEGLETFLTETPITGPTAPLVAAGKFAQWTGVFSSKSREEWIEYYKHGKDPVRKNRYWILGKTPWMGEGITHYKPNSYKMAMSEWQYTDTVYGSREIYWKHSFLPTPRYPLAPIRRFITNPYWFEKMHLKDRPYPVSGGLFDSDTPWGMLGNMTVGRILKPMRDYNAGASKEDLEEQAEKDFYPKLTIAQYKGGDLNLFDYTPKFAMGNKESLKNTEIENKSIITRGKASRARSILKASTSLSKEEGKSIASYNRKAISGKGIIYVGNNNNIRPINIDSDNISSTPYVVETDGDKQLHIGGNAYSMDSIAAINNTIQAKGKTIKTLNEDISSTGYVIGHKTPFKEGDSLLTPQDPSSINYQVNRAIDIVSELPGARTFVTETALGGNDYGEGTAYLEDAGMAYQGASRFRASEMGGRGGAISEVARRLWTKKPGLAKGVNNIPNMMPDWMPDHFGTGDPYRKVDGGEYRLPGEAYESLHRLHPDKFGKYGAVDRAAILADVAPWSQEYKFWLKVAREQGLDKDEKAFLKRALERTKKQTDNLHLTPYKFINNNLKKENAKIEKFIDSNRFTLMGSNQVFRLAGVHNSFNSETQSGMKALRVLEKNMMPGQEVTLVYNKHDKKDSTPAVVYANSQNVNKLLIEQGVTKREESGPISSYVDMNFLSRSAGYAWETIAHSRIPVIQNKILNVNSPMEHYKNFGLYGKDFQNWQEPIEDFVVPEFQSAIARHPFSAALTMTSVGGVTGWLIAGKKGAKVGAAIGAASGIIGSLGRIAHEIESGKAWIPKRRQKERDINEYFDRLKYLKYKRLYNKYSELAKIKEDVDLESTIKKFERLDKHINDEQEKAKNTVEKIRRTGLHHGSSVRKIINKNGRIEHKLVTDKGYLSKVSSEMTEEINELQNKSYLVGLGPYAKKAVEYRQKYKSTLYSVDEENTNMQSIMRALPKKDREYFKNFIKTTDPEQRKEILRLVPEDQKRAYQILWGMNPNKKEDMASYFKDHYLPDDSWIGWKEGIDLEDAQIKTIENQGLDEKDFGIWKDHTEDEYLTPGPAPANIGYDKRNVDIFSIRKELHQILEEYDLKDIEIEIEPNKNSGISIDLQVMHNREAEIEEKIVNVLGA